MAFRDDINRNLANAPGAASRAEQERFQGTVNKMCNFIKEYILLESQEHKNPRIPFKVEFCVFADTQCAFKTRIIEERKPGLFNNTRRISEMTISDEMITFHRAVKNQLARDGIQVSDWMLSGNYYLTTDDSSYCISCGNCDIFRMKQSGLKPLNINPHIPFRRRDYQTIGGASGTVYHSEFTQGNARYDLGPKLVFVVKYQ